MDNISHITTNPACTSQFELLLAPYYGNFENFLRSLRFSGPFASLIFLDAEAAKKRRERQVLYLET